MRTLQTTGREGESAGARFAALAAVVSLAAALRFFGLDHQSFWADEVSSIGQIRGGVGGTLEALASDVHPPLYFLLLDAWSSMFGFSEIALRSLSALCSTIATALLFGLGSRLFGARIGFAAALLFATSLFQIHYAQETRSYALFVLAAVASMDAFERVWRAQRGRAVGALAYYAIASVAMLYTHYFGAFVLVAQAVGAVWLVAGRDPAAARRQAFVRAALGLGIVGLAFLPWVGVFRAQLVRVQSGFWIPPVGEAVLWKTPGIFLGVRRPPWAQRPHWEEIGIAFAVLAALGLALASWRRGRAWLDRSRLADATTPHWTRRDAIGLSAAWLLVPVAAAAAASALASLHTYTYRNLIAAQPAACLLLAWVWSLAPTRWLKAIVAAALLAGSIGQLPWYYGADHKGRWHALVAHVERGLEPDDGVAFFTHFVKRTFDFHRLVAGEGGYTFVDLRRLERPRVARIWLVKAHARGHNFDDAVAKLRAWGYERRQSWRFAQAEVLLFERPGA